LHAWVDAEDSEIKCVATELESTNPPLVAEIWRLHNWQQRVNDVHHIHINCIYSLEGFTGCVPSNMIIADGPPDVDETSAEMIEDELEGDEAA
jgi:hypothetical protein